MRTVDDVSVSNAGVVTDLDAGAFEGVERHTALDAGAAPDHNRYPLIGTDRGVLADRTSLAEPDVSSYADELGETDAIAELR